MKRNKKQAAAIPARDVPHLTGYGSNCFLRL